MPEKPTFGKAARWIEADTVIIVLDEEGHGMEVTQMAYLINEDAIQLKVKSQ